jgi:hypothetical protein
MGADDLRGPLPGGQQELSPDYGSYDGIAHASSVLSS